MTWATHVLQWRLTKRSEVARQSKTQKQRPSSDCRLQLACTKSELLVIADQQDVYKRQVYHHRQSGGQQFHLGRSGHGVHHRGGPVAQCPHGFYPAAQIPLCLSLIHIWMYSVTLSPALVTPKGWERICAMGYRLLAGSPALADSLIVSCSLQELPRSVFIIITQSIKICVDFFRKSRQISNSFLVCIVRLHPAGEPPRKKRPARTKKAHPAGCACKPVRSAVHRSAQMCIRDRSWAVSPPPLPDGCWMH